MARLPIKTFIFIILLAAVCAYIDLPKIKIFGKTFSHPKIQNAYIKRDLEPKLGLDLAGGVQLTLSADMSKVDAADRDSALESAKNVIENRVNGLGVSEPVIQSAKTQGQYRIIVELPGISDIETAVATVKKAAHLEFMVIKKNLPPESSSSAQFDPNSYIATDLTGKDLKRAIAQPSQDPQNPGYVINLEFNSEGTKKLTKITQENLNKSMAMFLDGAPIPEAWPPPTIRAVITDGRPQISGRFDAKSARQLAIQLNAGALPVPLKIESQQQVGPTIGAVSIKESLIATAIGLASVAAFMIIYYGYLGIFATVALTIYTLITFAVYKLIPVTLTLAGIAGFVLSIGMAVDANILIFERMKEEIRWGKPKHDALFAGFDRAWSSIRDSNVSSLITTAILYNFGTGPIKGFALTLAIGILISLFSAITVTKTLLRIFYVRKIV